MRKKQAQDMKWSLTVEEIVTLLECGPVEGAFDGEIVGISDLRKAEAGELSFLSNHRFEKYLQETRASVILLNRECTGEPGANQAWIRVEDPSLALGMICEHIEKRIRPQPDPGIHPSAVVSPGATIDASAHVGPNCVIGDNVSIGANTVLESNVTVERNAIIGNETHLYHGVFVGWGCQVGNRCILFPGAVIGADGFGFHSGKSGHQRLSQIGIAVLEDDVEIGANSTVDRARFAETRIGKGTKIDNLVQIGHNVIVGQHCILCAGVGISGSTELGNFVILAGHVGVGGHLKVGDGVTATGKSGISKDIPPGMILSGVPARDHRDEMRKAVLLKRIPQLQDRIKALEGNLCK